MKKKFEHLTIELSNFILLKIESTISQILICILNLSEF